jgi:hypothetical protein
MDLSDNFMIWKICEMKKNGVFSLGSAAPFLSNLG